MSHDLITLRRYATDRDEAAFREIVECHLDAVYSMAFRRVAGDSHLAEDIAQEVFIALARQAESLTNHSTLTGWLYAATRNAAANAVRSEHRRKNRETEVFSMQDNQADERSHAQWRDHAPVLEGALDRLHEADRIAVLFRFVDELEFSEIATSCMPNGSIRTDSFAIMICHSYALPTDGDFWLRELVHPRCKDRDLIKA